MRKRTVTKEFVNAKGYTERMDVEEEYEVTEKELEQEDKEREKLREKQKEKESRPKVEKTAPLKKTTTQGKIMSFFTKAK